MPELAPGVTGIAHLRRGVDLDVWEAWDGARDCACVAKTLRPDRLDHAPARSALVREGRLLLRLRHPGIVRAYDLVGGERPVLVLETRSGATLEHVLAGREGLTVGDACELGVQLCSAVGYLHRHGWLHLDVKPSNVVCDGGRAVLLDLSIARRPGRGVRGAGTRQYMAPEQVAGGRLAPATDVWALGSVLYEALAGTRPHPDGVAVAATAPPLRSHRRLPARLAAAIDACLDPDPTRRPLLAELAAVVSTRGRP